MPGVSATVGEQIEALRAVAGEAAVKLIRRQRDETIERIVAGWPSRFDASRATQPRLRRRNQFRRDHQGLSGRRCMSALSHDGAAPRAASTLDRQYALRSAARRSRRGRADRAAAPRALGLAGRLLLLTIGFVLLAMGLFYATRLSAYRDNWLRDRLMVAHTAMLVVRRDERRDAARGARDEDPPQRRRQDHRRHLAGRAAAGGDFGNRARRRRNLRTRRPLDDGRQSGRLSHASSPRRAPS